MQKTQVILLMLLGGFAMSCSLLGGAPDPGVGTPNIDASGKEVVEEVASDASKSLKQGEVPATKDKPALEDAADLKPPPGMPDLNAIVGSDRENRAPAMLSQLQAEMGRDDVEQILKGGGGDPKKNTVKVAIKDRPGVKDVELSYNAKGLRSVRIHFEAKHDSDAFRDYLLKACDAKFGDRPPPKDGVYTYTTANFKTSKVRLIKGEGYELEILL